MKKSIQNLITKLEVDSNGAVKGGFTSIKGGAAFNVPAPNENCTNGDAGSTGSLCEGTNSGKCTNNGNCIKTTNTVVGESGCTNAYRC